MLLKSFRYMLLPFSLVYGGVVWVRNWLYDRNVLKSSAFNFPIICVGNLAVGGTGKTPMVEYLVRMLKEDYKTATLSRGYKRKTEGFAIADANTTALEIGDEPMQFHQKFPDITVSVGEERLVAIPQLLQDRPDTEVIILDDAMQHREVRAGLNILLTEYRNLYTRDLMLPAGDLRDVKVSSSRANIIIVTKCKPGLTLKEKDDIIAEIDPAGNQAVYFTKIVYGKPYHLFMQQNTVVIRPELEILLVCGIANPRPLKQYLNEQLHTYELLRYPDHHIFSIDDLEDIKKQFGKMRGTEKIILTTEKDAVRLHKFESELKDLPIYVIPIEHEFLFDEGEAFRNEVKTFISGFKKVEN
jgi:tetraacyldisaccharide 4'-kinase